MSSNSNVKLISKSKQYLSQKKTNVRQNYFKSKAYQVEPRILIFVDKPFNIYLMNSQKLKVLDEERYISEVS